MLGDVSVGENARSVDFQGMEDDRDRLRGEGHDYKTEMEKLRKRMVEKEVATRAMT